MTRYTDSEALAALEAIDPATTPSFTRGDVAPIAAAVAERDDAERRILDAVREARARRVPWTMIASALGVTHQAARQRYKPLTELSPAP